MIRRLTLSPPAETGMGNREGNRVEHCSEREISPLAYYDTKQYLDIKE